MDDSLLLQLRRRWAMRFGAAHGGDLRPGAVVKLVGVARPADEPRVSPFTGRECVLYEVTGQRMEGTGRERRSIRIADEEWSSDFWLDRGEDRVRIEPDGWLRLLGPARRVRNDPTMMANLDAFAARYGNHEREFFEGFGGGASYTERCLEVGARVAVIGEAHALGAQSTGYREAKPVFALRAPKRGRLWLSVAPEHLGGR